MENKIGIIPNINVSAATGPKEYCILLTDLRAIFVMENASHAMLGMMVGGAVGAIGASLLSSKKTVDYENVDVEHLASDKKNIVILYSDIQKIRIKKSFASPYILYFEYINSNNGKNRKITAAIVPPKEQIKQKKKDGIKTKAINEEYAQNVQNALKNALPQSVVIKSDWI